MDWSLLYRSLWENSRVLGEGPQVLIPLTLIFEGGSSVVRDWYFTHRQSSESDPPSGIYRKRLPSAADGNRDVFSQLMKAYRQEGNSEAGGVVAAMVWQEPSSEGKAKGGGRMCTCNLLEEDLRQLLLEGRGAPSSSSPWILQAFVTPDFESPLTTIVSEPPHDIGVSTVSARFKPRVLINKYRFQSVNELSWSMAPEHVTAATKFSSDDLYSIIVYQSQLSDACIHASLDSEKNYSEKNFPFSFYFRYVETTREIFLLWACPTSSRMHTVAFSSLLAGQSARPKPAPPATPPAPLAARNDTLLKEVFASYGMEGSSSVGAKGASTKQQQQQQQPRPKSSGSHPSARPGKSQKDAIAELYLKQSKPLRQMKAGQMKLPPWKEVNRVKYEEPAERLDRYEQAKRIYAVRNIGFFDPITPLPMTPLEDEPYCRPVSSQVAPSSSFARPSTVGGGTSFSSGRRPIISDEVSLDLDASGMPPNARQFQSTPIVAAAPRPRPAPAQAPAAAPIVPPSFVSMDSPEHQPGPPLSPSVPKNPSNALRHAAQFGHKGRIIRKTRKSAEPSVNAIIAPPGSSEDLIDYTTAIIVKVCDALSWNLSMAFEFAEDHGEAVAELRKKRVAGEAAATAPAVPELDTHSVVAEILQRLGTGEDYDREVSDDEDEEEEEEEEYQQKQKQKQKQGHEEEKEGKSKKKSLSAPQNSLFKVLEMLICIPNHRPADQLCTILLWLLSSAANKSSATTLDRMHDDLKSQKSMLKGFSNFAFDVRSVLAGVSANKSQRAAGKDPTTQSTIEAAVYLRSWIQDKYQIFVQEEAAPALETMQVEKLQGQDGGDAPAFELAAYFMNATTNSAADDESSPLSEILPPHSSSSSPSSPVTAVLQSVATAGDPTDLFPKKPIFSGPIKRLGREYKVASPSSSAASASKSATPAGTDNPARQPLPGTEKIRKVRVHLGMQLFLAALKLPGPRLFDEPPKNKEAGIVRQSLSSAVLPPTLSSYDEHPADEDDAQEGEAEKEVRRLAASLPRTSSSAEDREMAFFELAPSLSPGQRSLLLNSFIIDMAQSVILNMSVLSRHASAGKEVTRSDLTALFGSPVIKVMGKKLVSRLLIWLHSNRRAAGSFKNASQTLIELALQRLYAFWPQLSVKLRAKGIPATPPLPSSRGRKTREAAPKPVPETPIQKQQNQNQSNGRGKVEARKSATVEQPKPQPPASRPTSRSNSRPTSRAGSTADIPVVNLADGSYIVASYVWRDRYNVERTFREPHKFVPNSSVV